MTGEGFAQQPIGFLINADGGSERLSEKEVSLRLIIHCSSPTEFISLLSGHFSLFKRYIGVWHFTLLRVWSFRDILGVFHVDL